MTTAPAITDTLISAAQGGDQAAMWQIVSACETLIAGIVHRVAPGAPQSRAEDLVQEARATLVERIRLYDTDASAASLQTFIYRSVRRAVAEEWIRMTTGLTVDPTTVLRAKHALAQYDGNREAAALSVYARHGIDRSAFMAATEALSMVDSLDGAPAGDVGDDLTLADVIADPSTDVTDPIERLELAEWLLSRIDSRQSYTLRAYYGVGMEPSTDGEVALHLRITPANVRKIRTRGIDAARSVANAYDVAA
jgi:RNA polymerase sigma factor (sigma-70 family)